MTRHRSMTKLALAVALAFAVATPAAAQVRDAVQVTLSDQEAQPGQEIVVSGQGFEPGTEAVISFDTGDQLGLTTVGHRGRFSRRVQIPPDVERGRHAVQVEGQEAAGDQITLEAPLLVTGPEAGRGSFVLVVVVALAVAAVLIVAAILLFRRRGGRREELAAPSTQEPTPFEAGRRPERR